MDVRDPWHRIASMYSCGLMAPDTSSLCLPEHNCFPANTTLTLKCGREISSTLRRGASYTQRHDPSDDRVTPRDPKACGAWRLTQRLDVHINWAVNLQRKSHRVTYLCDWPSVYQTGANSEPQNWNVKHLLLATKLTEGLATFSNPHHRSGVLTEGKNSTKWQWPVWDLWLNFMFSFPSM